MASLWISVRYPFRLAKLSDSYQLIDDDIVPEKSKSLGASLGSRLCPGSIVDEGQAERQCKRPGIPMYGALRP